MDRHKLNNKDIHETGVSLGAYSVDRDFGNRVPQEVVVYTILGKHAGFIGGDPILNEKDGISPEDQPTAYAKQVNRAGQKKYFIKMSNNGKLFNPIGMMDEARGTQLDRQRGRNTFEFTEVNQQAFQMYVMFLRTKNVAYLTHAEREGYLR